LQWLFVGGKAAGT